MISTRLTGLGVAIVGTSIAFLAPEPSLQRQRLKEPDTKGLMYPEERRVFQNLLRKASINEVVTPFKNIELRDTYAGNAGSITV